MADTDTPAGEPSRRVEIKNVMAQEDCYTVEELPDESSDEGEFVEASERLLHFEANVPANTATGTGLESVASRATGEPLRLLDLPIDILAQIVDRITHTRDLLPLARTHSTLHHLTIPHIYSRFEIVWPPPSANEESEPDIDALTHGLTTLTFADEVLDAPATSPCMHCGHSVVNTNHHPATSTRKRKRRGNHYASFVRHFSLSNGPLDAVREYMLTRDNGKMLGTLVALAVARMPNLKTFIWDMPTGVSRDVFIALSALEYKVPLGNCKLDKVWIRWHNRNTLLYTEGKPRASSTSSPVDFTPPPPPPPPPPGLGSSTTPATVTSPRRSRAGEARVFEHPNHAELLEQPTLSELPAVRSLTVLDIDEVAYLDEMSLLVSKSRDKLRKVRIGIAKHVVGQQWTQPSHGDDDTSLGIVHRTPQQSEARRWGGVLGTVFGRPAIATRHKSVSASDSTDADNDTSQLDTTIRGHAASRASTCPKEGLPDGNSKETTQLYKLQALELERVSLSVFALTKSIDWSQLTELTLFSCQKDELLWKSLRKLLAPKPASSVNSTDDAPRASFWGNIRRPDLANKKPCEGSQSTYVYPCRLRKIQTNRVSKALLNFLTHTLAPDSLEVLFLQDHGSTESGITVDDICKGPIKRHRASLKRLMVVSGTCDTYRDMYWTPWIASHDVLSFLSSGRLTNLRELGVAINSKDWHYFLQRLPMIPQLRSIYIPHIEDSASTGQEDARQLALHILDIVTLRPDIKLAYLGIFDHCFDIREARSKDRDLLDSAPVRIEEEATQIATNGTDVHADDDDDDDEDDVDDDNDNSDSGEEGQSHENSDVDEDMSFLNDEKEDDTRESGPCFRLREIVWYERKVAIFKARHARIRGWRASDKLKQDFDS